jgi:hypothetical protein
MLVQVFVQDFAHPGPAILEASTRIIRQEMPAEGGIRNAVPLEGFGGVSDRHSNGRKCNSPAALPDDMEIRNSKRLLQVSQPHEEKRQRQMRNDFFCT